MSVVGPIYFDLKFWNRCDYQLLCRDLLNVGVKFVRVVADAGRSVERVRIP